MPLKRIAAVLAIATLMTAPATAGKFNAVLSVGDRAPDFGELPGTDGQTRSLDDFATAQAIVIVFTCNHCPVARGYEARLKSLAEEWSRQGVQFVAINCSRLEADQLPAMKQRADESGLPFPYLRDDSQQSATRYGASVTPQVFLLDGQRRVAYSGAIDDQWKSAEQVERRYLSDAIRSVLAGRAPEIAETRPVGCHIAFDD